jgi:hypothetical protein
MTVVATSGAERLTIALLYSCGTSNELYRELEKSADTILYRGAPYHQHEYAYGIKVHVGPVTGWLPPLAPLGKSVVAQSTVLNDEATGVTGEHDVIHFPLAPGA